MLDEDGNGFIDMDDYESHPTFSQCLPYMYRVTDDSGFVCRCLVWLSLTRELAKKAFDKPGRKNAANRFMVDKIMNLLDVDENGFIDLNDYMSVSLE